MTTVLVISVLLFGDKIATSGKIISYYRESLSLVHNNSQKTVVHLHVWYETVRFVTEQTCHAHTLGGLLPTKPPATYDALNM